ncbi:general odorant-binding protein 99a-like [Eupeodes corollae]|uniref:OBP13 n=1 Tax=Eupeodes corollae TaxID=290404 RepID=A0A8F9RZH2_9MUSC|nr:general odorant-binding protein 99a-like [Eupeodes corollae]QYL00040.1 OBP13 [Eupeodes corollae]
MKTFLVIFAIIAAVVADEWVPKKFEEIKGIRAECLASNPLSTEQVDSLKAFIYPDEEPVRKYIQCCSEKLEIFCEHEGYHVDRIVKQFKLKMDEAEATAIVEKCVDKNEQKSSADVWVFRGHKCLMGSKIGDGIKEFVQKAMAKKA